MKLLTRYFRSLNSEGKEQAFDIMSNGVIALVNTDIMSKENMVARIKDIAFLLEKAEEYNKAYPENWGIEENRR